jgi:26S proteasome regulatory subunit N12
LQRQWTLQQSTNQITFPRSTKADIRIHAQQGEADAPSADVLKGKGVTQGVPMNKIVGPALSMAAQLEMIV